MFMLACLLSRFVLLSIVNTFLIRLSNWETLQTLTVFNWISALQSYFELICLCLANAFEKWFSNFWCFYFCLFLFVCFHFIEKCSFFSTFVYASGTWLNWSNRNRSLLVDFNLKMNRVSEWLRPLQNFFSFVPFFMFIQRTVWIKLSPSFFLFLIWNASVRTFLYSLYFVESLNRGSEWIRSSRRGEQHFGDCYSFGLVTAVGGASCKVSLGSAFTAFWKPYRLWGEDAEFFIWMLLTRPILETQQKDQ